MEGSLSSELWFKLLLALACGAAIGLERELSGKPAGLRTNMLISVGSTLITMVSIHIALVFSERQTVVGDPARIAGEMISGIGFLGAGAIIQARGSVHGLTTAATIWFMAGVGLAIGSGAYAWAIVTTIIVLVILVLLRWVERRLIDRREHFVQFHITARRGPGLIRQLNQLASEHGFPLTGLALAREGDKVKADFALTCTPGTRDALVEGLLEHEAVEDVRVSE